MHPLLFEVSLGSYGAYRVSAFGALFALGLTVGLVLTVRLGTRSGLAEGGVTSAALAAVLTGIVAARLGFVLLHPGEIASVREALSLRSGGLSGPLGLVVGAGVLAWVGKRRRIASAPLLDVAAPGFVVGALLTRFGCWLEGCDFGKSLGASAPALLVRLGTFPAGSPAWVEQVLARSISPSAPASLPVHPSELYDAAVATLLLGLLTFLRRQQRSAGIAAAGVAVAYLVLRVVVDFTRAPSNEAWAARVLAVAALVFVARFSARTRTQRA